MVLKFVLHAFSIPPFRRLAPGFYVKMIKIQIEVKDGKVFDSFNHNESTLQENSLTLRRLEEIKQDLLSIDYQDDLLIM